MPDKTRADRWEDSTAVKFNSLPNKMMGTDEREEHFVLVKGMMTHLITQWTSK